jgi:hypothetical protein
MRPVQSAILLLVGYCCLSWLFCNVPSPTRSVQLMWLVLQHHISKLWLYLWSSCKYVESKIRSLTRTHLSDFYTYVMSSQYLAGIFLPNVKTGSAFPELSTHWVPEVISLYSGQVVNLITCLHPVKNEWGCIFTSSYTPSWRAYRRLYICLYR